MNVLATGAHFDDVELGCGGTLAAHVRRGDNVWVFVATHSGYANPSGKTIRPAPVALEEGRRGADILGVNLITGKNETNTLQFSNDLVCEVLVLIEEYAIDTIYTHWTGDAHQDHYALGRASIAAGKHVPRVLMYRSNNYDSTETFAGTFYVDVSHTADTKRRAIEAHQSELSRVGGKWLDMFMARGELIGSQLGVAHAEAFQVVKYMLSVK